MPVGRAKVRGMDHAAVALNKKWPSIGEEA
jgi:hypothetical protein